jgi:spore germination protein YaaH
MERAVHVGSLVLLVIALFLAGWTLFFPEQADSVPPTPAPTSLPLNTAATPVPLPSVDPLPDDPIIPEVVHPKSGRYVAAWMPTDWDTDNARASFEANLDYIDEISPVWYDMRSNGTLSVLGGARDQTLVDEAHAAGVLVLPSITNGFDPDRTGYVLRNAERRSEFVQRIIDEVEEYNYDGIDIDFEAMPSSERDVFTAFIRELADGLHQRGKILAIAIHARTSDSGGAFGAQAQDWHAIGQAVDRFRIMTYDYHWSGGGAGPVAPIYWVQEVMEYAKTRVDPAKIQVGVPFYGYDWVGTDGWPVTWLSIQELLEIHEPKVSLVERDAQGEVAESTFNYRDSEGYHTVWFSSARSMEAKLDLVKQYDLAGIAIWRLGGEDPSYWRAIRDRLARDPYEVQRSIVRYLPDP